MTDFKDLYQSADWKSEKHVPVIDAPDTIVKGEMTKINVTIGKEVAHPNTTAHHIDWIQLFFLAEGEKYPYEIAKTTFSAHGASTNGPDSSTIVTHHEMSISFKTDKPGTLLAASSCNIHGLWQSAKQISIQ